MFLFTWNIEFISLIVWGDDIQDSEIRSDKTIHICITWMENTAWKT